MAGANCEDGYVFTSPVGSFIANDYGLYDMLGNAWEWVEDLYVDSYAGAPSDGSVVALVIHDEGSTGGSWNLHPRNIRAADRNKSSLDVQISVLGFRLGRWCDNRERLVFLISARR